ncbi:hypothetical protein SOV_22830 [Sporomusa ovata DSM 2662]|uniref:Uncharacterized protein n=1 Tax=Sporomusa ovata TaxID=2378 RepID=A0A0U1L3B8_9FIRM|nr:hypothetical protein [Sporomusa ovata]EQB25599.1 hypothetical protein SOV_4c02620 [Sporomusa ovata DSM 2662]CQR74156.1 hypothetical protein SpAn4DRAFT_0618 [Sporomusa ovata]
MNMPFSQIFCKAKTVGITPIELCTGNVAKKGRNGVGFKNMSDASKVVYVLESPTQAITDGYPVAAGTEFIRDVKPDCRIWVASDTAGVPIRAMETTE